MTHHWLPQSDIGDPAGSRAQAHVEGARFGDWMQTFSGAQFWPMDPRASEIDIEDIAHSLSMQCRYAGHCKRFYSVAEHSVHVAAWVGTVAPKQYALAGLLHDATEAFLVDVPRPVKPFLPGYKEAEARLWDVVAERFFGHAMAIPAIVHEADNRILNDEREQNMSPPPQEWAHTGDPLGITLEFWTPEQAEFQFLTTFYKLTEPV